MKQLLCYTWICLFISTFICLAYSISFYPPPGPYILFAGENLQISIYGLKNQTCVYETSTKDKSYKCVFKKSKTNGENAINGDENNCYSKVDIVGDCEIRLKNYQEDDPRNWTLYQQDNTTNKLSITVDLYYKSDLYNSEKAPIMETGSVIQYLVIKNSPKLTKCTGIFGNKTFDINLETSTFNTESEDDFANRARPLGGGKCGYQLTNAKLTDSDIPCFLIAESEDKKRYRAKFAFNVAAKKETNETLNVDIGDGITIPCEQNDICSLQSPTGEKIKPTGNRCTYYIKTVTPEHIGKWICKHSTSYSMESLVSNINLVAKEYLKVETWSKEVDNKYHIGCKVTNNPRFTKDFCVMTLPSGEILYVNPKIGTNRYSAFTTDLENGICGLEIQKPLLESEKGNWKCQVNDEIGTFVSTSGTTNSYPRRTKKTVQIGEDVSVSCQVPYSSEYCQITSPKGDIFDSKYQYRSWLGECTVIVKNVTKEHNGTWTCNFARKTGIPDEQIYFDLKVAETLLTYKVKQVTKGDSVSLMCQTGVPIKYCRFVTPNGLSYYLREHANTTIDYAGRGLEYGDCGVEIRKATEKHSGTWTCITKIGNNAKEIKANVYLQVNDVPFFENGTNVAASVGASLGVVIVLAGIGFYIWRKRRQNNPNYTLTSRNSDTSGSNEHIVEPTRSPTGPAILYDTDDNVIYQIRQRNSLDYTR